MSKEVETMEFQGDELSVEYEIVGVTHHRGARSSLGVPEEPDDYESYCEITKVEAFGVDITEKFDIGTIPTEDIEERVYETFKLLFQA